MKRNNKTIIMQDTTKIFDNKNIRMDGDDEQQEWYFCLVDVVDAY
jgi:hypothetical protein